MSEKWTCNLNRNQTIGDRCTKDNNGPYDNKQVCESKCEEKVKSGIKIADWITAKQIEKYIDPNSLTDEEKVIFENIKEIPLFYKDGKPYNKKLLEQDKIQNLYSKLNILKQNYFFLDLIKQTNSFKGESFYALDELDEDGIIKVNNNFFNDEFVNNFLNELKELKDYKKQYLIKELTFYYIKGPHALLSLSKYNESNSTYQFFAFDPSYANDYFIILEDFINNKIAKGLPSGDKIEFINLSSFYGIQNFEITNFLEIFFKNEFENFLAGEIELFRVANDNFLSKNMDLFKENLSLNYNNLDDFKSNMNNNVFKLFYQENGNKKYEEMVDFILDGLYEFKKNRIPKNLLLEYQEKVLEKYDQFYNEINKIKSDFLIKKELDYYEGKCYAWCCYVCVLMLTNPTLSPNDIIKFAFYQTTNPYEMKKIYREFKIKILKEDLNFLGEDIFSLKRIDNKIKIIKEKKDKIIEQLNNPSLVKHHKMLYQKITNLIFLMSKYNYLKNPNYFKKIKFEDTIFYNFSKSLGIDQSDFAQPDEDNEIVEFIKNIEFVSPHDSSTPDKILESIKTGILSSKLAELIIGSTINKTDMKLKYIKYKLKYLHLKNSLNQKN